MLHLQFFVCCVLKPYVDYISATKKLRIRIDAILWCGLPLTSICGHNMYVAYQAK